MLKNIQNQNKSYINNNFINILSKVFLSYSFVIILMLVFCYLTKEVLEFETLSFDKSIINLIAQLRSPQLTPIMIQVSYIGETGAMILITILSLYVIINKQYYTFLNILFSTSSALLFTYFFKKIIMRSRPDPLYRLISESSYSYPSGHATVTFTIFPIIAIYFILLTKLKYSIKLLISIITMSIPILVSFSRLYLGVHYFTDILAGALVGLTFGLVFYIVTKKIININLLK